VIERRKNTGFEAYLCFEGKAHLSYMNHVGAEKMAYGFMGKA